MEDKSPSALKRRREQVKEASRRFRERKRGEIEFLQQKINDLESELEGLRRGVSATPSPPSSTKKLGKLTARRTNQTPSFDFSDGEEGSVSRKSTPATRGVSHSPSLEFSKKKVGGFDNIVAPQPFQHLGVLPSPGFTPYITARPMLQPPGGLGGIAPAYPFCGLRSWPALPQVHRTLNSATLDVGCFLGEDGWEGIPEKYIEPLGSEGELLFAVRPSDLPVATLRIQLSLPRNVAAPVDLKTAATKILTSGQILEWDNENEEFLWRAAEGGADSTGPNSFLGGKGFLTSIGLPQQTHLEDEHVVRCVLDYSNCCTIIKKSDDIDPKNGPLPQLAQAAVTYGVRVLRAPCHVLKGLRDIAPDSSESSRMKPFPPIQTGPCGISTGNEIASGEGTCFQGAARSVESPSTSSPGATCHSAELYCGFLSFPTIAANNTPYSTLVGFFSMDISPRPLTQSGAGCPKFDLNTTCSILSRLVREHFVPKVAAIATARKCNPLTSNPSNYSSNLHILGEVSLLQHPSPCTPPSPPPISYAYVSPTSL